MLHYLTVYLTAIARLTSLTAPSSIIRFNIILFNLTVLSIFVRLAYRHQPRQRLLVEIFLIEN